MTIRELNREQRPKYKNHHVDDDDNDDDEDEQAATSPLDDMMIRPIDDDNNNNSNIPSPPSSPLQVTFDDNHNHNNNNHTNSTSSDSLDENSNSNNNNNSSSMPRIPSIGSSLMMMSPLTGNPFSFPHLRSSNSLYELETLSKSASSISLSSYLKDFPISSSSSSSSLNHNNNNNNNSNSNNNNNNNNSNNNSQNNDQVDLMKSASTYSLSDYVSSANLLKSPSTSSLSALQKSSSSSSLSELHASSLLKSSSCASFSKYQVCDDVDNDDDDGVDVNVDVDGIGCDHNENDDDQHHKSSNIDSSGDGSGVNNMNNNNQKKKKKKKKKSKKKKNLNDDDAERSENLSDETMNRNEREQLSSSSRTTRPLSSGVNLLPSSASIISPLDSPVNSVDHGAVVVNNRNNNSLLPSLYDRLLGSSGSAQNRNAPAINVTQPIPPLSQQNHHHHHHPHNHSHHSSSHHSHMTSASSTSPPPPPYSHVPQSHSHSHSHSYPAPSATPAHHSHHPQHHHHPHCPHHPYSHHHQPSYQHSYPVAPPSSSSELPPNNPHLYKQYSAAFGSAPQNTTVPPSYPPFGFNPVQPSGSSIRMLENHPYMNVVAPTDPYVSQSHLPHQHHQHPSINIQQQQESAHIHPSSVKVHNYSMHAHQEAPPQRSSSPPISTFEQFNKRQNEEQPILNPTLDPNIQVPQGEYVKINGEMYNDRGYKICGHLNQHSKPCQRIGKCPFHWKLTKDKEEGESTAGTGNDNGSPASNTEESDSTPVKNEVAISEQFNQTAAAVMPAPPQRTPMKRGPYKQGWSKEEHLLFLKGLKQHGKGAWKEISTIVGTRTPTQIQSHAQKYFLRQKQKVKNKRSIHDITMDDLSGNNNGRGSRDDPDEEESDSDSSEEEITQSANKRAKTMHDAPRNTMDAPPAAIVTTQARSSPPLPMSQLTPQALHNAHADFQKMVAMFPNIHPNVLAQLIAMNSLQATTANQQPEGTSNSSPPTIDYSLLADQRQKTT